MDIDQPLILVTSKPVSEIQPTTISKSKIWSIQVAALKLTDGKIYIDNEIKPRDTTFVNGIDYSHLILEDLDMAMDSIQFTGPHFLAKNVDLHLLHQNGFEIKSFTTSSADISPEGLKLDDLSIKTNGSEIHNSLEFKYSGYADFKSFADSVNMIIPTADIHLHIPDLLTLVPSLNKVSFFSDNKDKDIVLQGNVDGHINRLKILNINLSMGGIGLTGDFRSRDLAVPGKQLLNLDLDKSNFSAAALKNLFPKMKVPEIMNRLGQINFSGKFDGYPDDFVAFGNFNTSLGGVTLDMNLNTLNGIADGKYSGTISFDNFDLGTLIDQPDLGRVTMTGRVIEGIGLNSQNLSADLTAGLTSITYKGYTYHNARMDGQISGKLFNGTLDINDPNVDMHFEGYADFRGDIPKLNFVARIDSIRFLDLGFGNLPIALSGIFDVDFTAGKIDQLQGSLKGQNVNVSIKKDNYYLDSISISAIIDSLTNDRYYNFKSDLASGTFSGVFNPLTLPNQLQQYLHEEYPNAIDAPKKIVEAQDSQRLSWDLHIYDSRQWLDLVGVKGLVIKKAYTHGTLNLAEKEANGYLELPEVHYAGVNVYGSTINFKEQAGDVDLDLDVIAADLNENLFFEDILISGSATDDSVNVRIKTDDIANIIDELDLEIAASPDNGQWTFGFNPVKLIMLGDNWVAPQGNKLQIKKGEFNLENFELNSGERKIAVSDINNKGISAFITGFDVSYLNSIWINDKFNFSGIYTLNLEIDNIYNIQQLSTVLHIPALNVNNKPYGEWTMNAAMHDPKDSVKIDIVMNHDETHLTGKGAYLPPIKSIPKENQNYLHLALEATDFPLDFLEFLLGGNIRNTEGSVDITLSLDGKTNKLNPKGKGRVYNGSTTIDYLGTAYSFHDQAFEITESLIDLSGDKLYDVLGNSATIQGGLTHRYLKNLGLNATITSDRILGLDVTSEQNTNFYGKGIGSVFAKFSGSIANPVMEIQLTTDKGTHIYIPLSGSAINTDKDFVIFLQNGQLPVSKLNQLKLSGIDLKMKMTITEDADLEIIFDDNTGEVLRAIGNGNVNLAMSRTGNLSMYGKYIIEKGDYLFTNFKVVRKKFELLKGGEIQWDGDPYEATINVRAKYAGLKAPIYTLIQEYILNNPSLANQARERWDVDLTMILTGSLLHPNIAFDIDFPTLTGEIKGYADSKVTALKANENAMNEQVMGLLITRSFLPSTSGVSTSGVISKGITNTLSEIISSTLSSYLGGLLANLIPEGTFLTGIDLQLGVDLPTIGGDVINQSGQFQDPNSSEYTLNLPLEFFNDRLSVNVGGNYVSGSTILAGGASQNYFAGDVTFEYQITADKRLKIRAYNRNNVTVEGRKNKVGLGVSYKREYNSFPEIFAKKKKKQNEPGITPSGE